MRERLALRDPRAARERRALEAGRARVARDLVLLGAEARRALDEAPRARVREFCARLPRKQREAVWRRWAEGEDYPTIARELGTSVESARANVYHGLSRLRCELHDLWKEVGS